MDFSLRRFFFQDEILSHTLFRELSMSALIRDSAWRFFSPFEGNLSRVDWRRAKFEGDINHRTRQAPFHQKAHVSQPGFDTMTKCFNGSGKTQSGLDVVHPCLRPAEEFPCGSMLDANFHLKRRMNERAGVCHRAKYDLRWPGITVPDFTHAASDREQRLTPAARYVGLLGRISIFVQ